jgi:cell division protein FtsB
MRNFQEKRGWSHIWQSKPFLLFLAVLVLIFAWNVFGFWGKMAETGKNRKIVEDKIAELKQQKEKLSSDITKLKTGEGVEETIRDKFGLVKEGEGMIVIVDDKNNTAAASESQSGGFFSFFRNLFK